MLDQYSLYHRLRRSRNIESALCERIVFAGYDMRRTVCMYVIQDTLSCRKCVSATTVPCNTHAVVCVQYCIPHYIRGPFNLATFAIWHLTADMVARPNYILCEMT